MSIGGADFDKNEKSKTTNDETESIDDFKGFDFAEPPLGEIQILRVLD